MQSSHSSVGKPCNRPSTSAHDQTNFHTSKACPVKCKRVQAKRVYSHLGRGCQERRCPCGHDKLVDHVSNPGSDGGQQVSDGFGLGRDVDLDLGHGGGYSDGPFRALGVPAVGYQVE